ncbi:HutD/Ves family protein [Rhodococcus sp. NPDC003322]
MSAVQLVRAAERRRVPWRNGAGVTEEIAVGPDRGVGKPLWRISVAELGDAPTVFSAYDGIDRIFTVVGDHAVTLEWDSHSVSLQPWRPHPFDGAAAPRCLPDQATRAFNVMTDATAAHAEAEFVDLGATSVTTGPDAVTALFVRSGTAAATAYRAEAGDCLVVRHDAVDLQGEAQGLLVRIHLSHSTG